MVSTNKDSRTYILPSLANVASNIALGYPFDTVKIRLQSGKYKNYKSCLKDIYTNAGLKGFYRGSTMPMVLYGILRPLEFQAYETCKKKFPGWKGPFAGGIITGFISCLISCPMHLLKIKMQTTNHKFKNVYDCSKHIYKNNGIRGFTQGFGINLTKDIIFNASFLGLYGNIKNLLPKSNTSNFMSGGLAGALTYTMFFPIDTIRTIIQASDTKIKIKDAALSVYNRGKINGNKGIIDVFWKGLPMVYIRIFPVSGAAMMSYEFVKKRTDF